MSRKILVIDDDRTVRESLKIILEDSYEVLLSSSAKEGLDMLSEDVGLVFLDYLLPDSNGLTVLRQIKKLHPSIPVIIITGYGTEDVCQRAFRAGTRDYIKKPFDVTEICYKTDLLMKGSNNHERRCSILSDLEVGHAELLSNKDVPCDILYNILTVKKYLDENYTREISLSEASKMAGMNRTYFCYYFKCITGHSFRAYFSNIRLKRAEEFFKNKNLSISDIAMMLGYNSVNYFIETFKRINGSSPAGLRKKLMAEWIKVENSSGKGGEVIQK